MKVDNFLICGTDRKMTECKNHLCKLGYDAVCMIGDDFCKKLNSYKYIVLPLPSIVNGVIPGVGNSPEHLINLLKDGQTVFYGNIEDNIFGECGFSYYYRESFLDKNSELTAQGLLKLIRNEISADMNSLKVCVVGYGRCGKAICRIFKKQDAEVTLISRNEHSRTSAEVTGCRTEDLTQLGDLIINSDIIINTVPVNIFSSECLKNLTDKNIYIEIASKPLGFDIGKVKNYDFKYIPANGLPGRFCPEQAGINIAEAVIEILKEGKYG